MAHVYQYGKAEVFEKELEEIDGKTVCAVLEPYDAIQSLLHLETRVMGEAPQRLHDKKYKLIKAATKNKAGQLKSGPYIVLSRLDYKLIKEGTGVLMEIEAPRISLIR